MDFKPFDKRGYPVLPVQEGYAAWSGSYEDRVLDLMDLHLLDRLRSIHWKDVRRAADLACGTGVVVNGCAARALVTSTESIARPKCLSTPRKRNIYDHLVLGDVSDSPFESSAYDPVTESLCDEHLVTLAPLYSEVSRLLAPGGTFVIAGYHWHF